MTSSLTRWPFRLPVPCLFQGCPTTFLLLSANTEIHSTGGIPAGAEARLVFSMEGRQAPPNLGGAIDRTFRTLGVRVEAGPKQNGFAEFRVIFPIRASGWTQERTARQVRRILELCRAPQPVLGPQIRREEKANIR